MSNPNAVPFLVQKFLYINELKITNNATTPNTVLDVSAGICRDQTDTYDLNLGNYDGLSSSAASNVSTSVNGAINGVNGLDTGVLVLSKVYNVYVIADTVSANPTALMLSLAAPAVGPLMPFGYSAYRHIGYAVTDASVHFLKAYQAGNNNARKFVYDAPISVGTTASSASYAAIDLTKFVPLVNNLPVYFNISLTGAPADTMNMQPGAATGDAIILEAAVNAQAVKAQVMVLAQTTAISTVPSPTVNYKNSGTDTITVAVGAFDYYI